jgi:preprotein translocase subunit SecG
VGVAQLVSKQADAAATEGAPKLSRTTITPASGTVVEEAKPRRVRQRRLDPPARPDLSTARAPFPGARLLRIGAAGAVFVLSLVTVAGAVLILLLWQQHRDAGVLTTQVDRAWELFGHLRTIERYLAFATIALGAGWVGMATINTRRATGHRRNPAVAVAGLLLAIAGIWFVGSEFVAPAEDWIGTAVGIAFQAVFVVLALLSLERVAEAAEARRRPLRATAIIAIVYLVHLEGLGGVSNIERTDDSSEWAMLGIYLVIGALIQALGALAVNEAARSIEEATQHRFELRNRFGESLLAQAALDHVPHRRH